MRWSYVVIALLVILYVVSVSSFYQSKKHEAEVSRYKDVQDSLSWVVEEMNKEIDFLDEKVGEAYARKDSLEGVVHEVSARESSLRKRLNNVKDSLEMLTPSELQIYFDVNYAKSDSVPAVILDSAQSVNVAVDVEQGKVNEQRIDLLLMERKNLYQLVVEDMKIITTQEEIIDKQERIIDAQEQKIELADERVNKSEKRLRREQTKTKIVGGAGIAAVVLILIIL